MSLAVACLFCDRPSTRLCDAALGMVLDSVVPRNGKVAAYKATSMEAMLSGSYTCDAPMCDQHAKVVGWVCGKDADTIDHCPIHQERHHDRNEPVTLEQLAALRSELHAQARRARFATITTGAMS